MLSLGQSRLSTRHLIVHISSTLKITAHIWISLVAFASQKNTFSAYGGTLTINRAGSSNLDLIEIFTKVQNPFYGLNSLSINLNQHSKIDFNINQNFILSV